MTNKNSLPHTEVSRKLIGGAIVTRGFDGLPADAPDDVRALGRPNRARVGAQLSAELVGRLTNRRALEDGGYIKMQAPAPIAAPAKTEDGEQKFRFAYHTGTGRYDVVEGIKLNAEHLTKEQAHALCEGFEPPPKPEAGAQ